MDDVMCTDDATLETDNSGTRITGSATVQHGQVY